MGPGRLGGQAPDFFWAATLHDRLRRGLWINDQDDLHSLVYRLGQGSKLPQKQVDDATRLEAKTLGQGSKLGAYAELGQKIYGLLARLFGLAMGAAAWQNDPALDPGQRGVLLGFVTSGH